MESSQLILSLFLCLFQQWHAPLVLSSLLTDNIVEQRKRRAITRWEQERARVHSELATRIRQSCHASSRRRTGVFHHDEYTKWAISNDLAAHPCPVKKDGTYRDDAAFLKREEGIDTHAEERRAYLLGLIADIDALHDSMKALAEDWTAILSCESRYSLSPTLLHVFTSEDQESCPADVLSAPLTVIRGEIFSLCHVGLADIPAYLPVLDGLFEGNSVYQTLWKEVMGKGGVPQGSFSVWLYGMLPYVEHRVRKSGIMDSVLGRILDTCAGRLHLSSPTQNREGMDPGYALLDSFALVAKRRDPEDASLVRLGELASLEMWNNIFKDGFLKPIQDDYLSVWSRGKKVTENVVETVEEHLENVKGELHNIDELLYHPSTHEKQGPSASRGEGKGNAEILEKKQQTKRKVTLLNKQASPFLLRYRTVFEALSGATRALSVVSSAGNLASMTEAVLRAHEQNALSSGLISIGKALPSLMTLTEEFRIICLRQTVGLFFQRSIFVAGLVGTGATFLEMLNQNQNTVALTSKMTAELALLALPFAGALGKLMGISLVLPVCGALVFVIVTGNVIYCLFRDDDEIAFLKNNIWNKRNKYTQYYDLLEEKDDKKFILNDSESKILNNMCIPSSEIWSNMQNIVGEQFSKFVFPHVSMGMNEHLVYIYIQSLNTYLGSDIDIQTEIQAKCTDMNTDYYSCPHSSYLPVSYEEYTVNINPVHEEKIHTEQYVIHETAFKVEDIKAFVRKTGKKYIGIQCTISVSNGSVPFEKKTYGIDAISPWINPAPQLNKRLDSLTESLTSN